MAGRLVPPDPVFRSRAEETVWRAVRSRLRDVDALVHGQRFTGRDGDWEIDLALLMPEGFVTVEVKGGHVWRQDGSWWQRTPDGVKRLDLEEQAVSGKYLLRRWLEAHWSHGRPRMGHLVALPDTDLDPGIDPSPGLPRAWIVDRSQTADLAGRAYDLLAGPLDQEPARGPGPDAVQAAADLLAGRGDPQRDVSGLVRVLGEHVARLTGEQARVLDLTRAMPQYRVVGGPGTGKTWLAVEQARRWAGEGRQVGFVCFSRGLATWVARLVAGWPRKSQARTWVGTYHALGVRWGVTVPDNAGQDWWEHGMPADMAAAAAGLGDGHRFDAVVVDEAQDVADTWWPSLLAAARDPDTLRLAVFGDDGQRVFGRTGTPATDLPTLTLDENLRNTRQIATAFAALATHPARPRGGSGPPVRFIPCHADEAVPAADDAADALIGDGWNAADIALLTTRHRHPVHRDQVERHGAAGYWTEFWDGTDVFYATVMGFKGLERPAVVLAVDGFHDPALARDLIYTGMSRARDQLTVCADPDQLRTLVGDPLTDRLTHPR